MIQGKYAIGRSSEDGTWSILEFWEGEEPKGSSPYNGGFDTEEGAIRFEDAKAQANGWEMHRLTRYDEELKMAV